jgi:hypothetical protein
MQISNSVRSIWKFHTHLNATKLNMTILLHVCSERLQRFALPKVQSGFLIVGARQYPVKIIISSRIRQSAKRTVCC